MSSEGLQEVAQRGSGVRKLVSHQRAKEDIQTHLQAIRKQTLQNAGSHELFPPSTDLQARVAFPLFRSTLISVAKNIAYSPLLFENHTLLTPL